MDSYSWIIKAFKDNRLLAQVASFHFSQPDQTDRSGSVGSEEIQKTKRRNFAYKPIRQKQQPIKISCFFVSFVVKKFVIFGAAETAAAAIGFVEGLPVRRNRFRGSSV